MEDSGQNPVVLPPQIIEKPTSVTVFGVLNIVFGGMGLICTPLGMLRRAAVYKTSEMAAGFIVWSLFLKVVSICFSIWLLVLGISLLMFKRWSRRGSIVYACVNIAWFIIAWGINILMVFLGWTNLIERGWAFLIAAMCLSMIGIIYPTLLLIFMQTAKVKRVFQGLENPKS